MRSAILASLLACAACGTDYATLAPDAPLIQCERPIAGAPLDVTLDGGTATMTIAEYTRIDDFRLATIHYVQCVTLGGTP